MRDSFTPAFEGQIQKAFVDTEPLRKAPCKKPCEKVNCPHHKNEKPRVAHG